MAAMASMRVGAGVSRAVLTEGLWRGELLPGVDIQSEQDIDEFIRANAESVYHPCGTCKMGEDETAVVDSQCRVHGIDGLRVADASIFPQITSANTNAPTIMVAEKVADHIKRD